MSEKIALFDMDNTLFDYEGQLRRDLEPLMSPNETMPENLWDESLPHIKARMNLIKSKPGWWRDLEPFDLGFEIYDATKEIGFNCHILTKGPNKSERRPHASSAWTEKVDCIYDHFGPRVGIDIVSTNKSNRYGHVLVDDYPEYVMGWLSHRPRGLAILPAHRYNAGFDHVNAIRYTGDNLDEVRLALKAVMARQHGEHWRHYMK